MNENLKEVTSETPFVQDDVNNFHDEGIFSEVIFGPKRDNVCKCGNYNSKILYKDKVCPKCNVVCGSSELRYSTYATIKTYVPYLKSISDIKSLIGRERFVIGKKYYLHYSNDTVSLKLIADYNDNCVPFVITGFLSLYIALVFVKLKKPDYKILCDQYIDKFRFNVLVIPPNTRPLNYDITDKTQVYNNDINKLYNSLLHIINFEELRDIDIEAKVKTTLTKINSTTTIIEDSVIIGLDQTSLHIFKTYNKIYNVFFDKKIKTKRGDIRNKYLARIIDYSARAVIIPNPKLAAHEVIIPKAMFIRLYMMEFYYYLREFVYKDKFKFLNENIINNPIKLSENVNDVDKIEYLDEFIEWFFENSDEIDRLIVINRQPSLWEYNCVACKIKGLSEDFVIELPKEILAQQAADFDGDQIAVYKFHDTDSKLELYDKMYMRDMIYYKHNGNVMHTLKDEGKFAFNLLMEYKLDRSQSPIIIDELKDLPEDYDYYDNYRRPVHFKGKLLTYGIALINKWAGFKEIMINPRTSTNDLSNLMFLNSADNELYRQHYTKFENRLTFLSSMLTEDSLKLPVNDMISLLSIYDNSKIINNLSKNPHINDIIYKALTEDFYEKIKQYPDLSRIAKISRKTIKALPKALISVGHISNDKDIIQDDPIKSSILAGLSEEIFFDMCSGSRKGFVDKEKSVPDMGTLLRNYAMIFSIIEIAEDDCGTELTLEVEIENFDISRSKYGQFFIDPETNQLRMFDEHDAMKYVGHKLMFRSPIFCNTKDYKVCEKCFGKYKELEKTKYNGIRIAQAITERLTQLAMSSFHTSGAMVLTSSKVLIELFKSKIINNEFELINYENNFKITLNDISDVEKTELMKIDGFIKIDGDDFWFNNISSVTNQDVNSDIRKMKSLLSKQENRKNKILIESAYSDYIEILKILLKFGDIYSTFVETLLCNIYYTNTDDGEELYRYALNKNPNVKISVKYNPKTIIQRISPITNLLINANKKSVTDYHLINSDNESKYLFEKLWNNEPL